MSIVRLYYSGSIWMHGHLDWKRRRLGRVPSEIRRSNFVESIPNEAGHFSGGVDHGENEVVFSSSDSDRVRVGKFEAGDHFQCFSEQSSFVQGFGDRIEDTERLVQQFHQG